jgi:hypothetical protein
MVVKESDSQLKGKGDPNALLNADFEAYQNILDSGRLRERLV